MKMILNPALYYQMRVGNFFVWCDKFSYTYIVTRWLVDGRMDGQDIWKTGDSGECLLLIA
mgnify:CR=1 FL=1